MRLRTALVALVVLAASCDSPTLPALPGRDADLGGTIVARDVQGTGPNIHVKADPDEECGIVLAIGRGDGHRTEIARLSADGRLRAAQLDDLEPGVAVWIWLAGDVADSCPQGGGAEAIMIRD